MGIFKKLGWYFRQEKKRYVLGVFFLALVALVNLIPPKIIGTLVDAMAARNLTMDRLLLWLSLMLFAGITQYLCRYGWRNAIWGGAAKLERTLRTRLFWHFMKMDATFYQKHRTGDLMAHATNDLNAIQNVAGAGILTLFDSIITGGTTIVAMMLFVDWRLTILAILPMPLLAVMARKLGMRLHREFARSQAAFSRLNDKTQESVSGIKVIKTFGQEAEDTADFNRIVDKTIKINKRVNFIDALFDPTTSLIMGITYVITIIYGGYLVVHGQISIGQLVSFVTYVAALVWPMFAIGRLFNILERGNASYDRVNELLTERSKIIEAPDAITTPAHGDIRFKINKFSYPNDDHATLMNVHFTLQQGQTLGIVGRVGAGKSTIFKLLLREFDDYDGVIEFGGHDIRRYTLDALLDSIGYVPQDNFLFSTTVADNIRFSSFDKNQAEVEDAAKKSDVHDDILAFTSGYQTMVGERGVSLSGGQKQRLAIARAVITAPELLIMDDSLSAVDAKTEAEILENMRAERADKTTIIAAQRLSSVMHANEIIVVADGRIIERGTHEQLLANHGWYAEMWAKQQLEQKLDGEAPTHG
ncbi:ABC transporter ATP-binding protein [Lacticaseibacillus nasuensis]|uniref:ABC-type multidrug transport system, ATPase and permease component n=1 Tax=Lacticaseibacillus nasuensis JCM 17158 TaxID=1291734 RepID=A0A0R1JSM4_9LACO|nr:ABC transporter transmembrane domain-containing protein [Lacticaseibacillus nasuensis]KRK74341.1 ABC-type multidrug transport system, ATPase and permease component [Lacticaseibacillus nasuensis JCM 17158]MCX2456167.1 ABC transporter transmembrane domain-containing protein [Lacticaseibacillus nasuensis]